MEINKYVITSVSLTDIGLERRKNEDSIGKLEIDGGYIFIVCDGMGGHKGGEKASIAAVRNIIKSLSNQKIENPRIALHNAIIFANQQIYLESQNSSNLKGMGTTVALLFIYKDEIFTAHVGDSRVYVLSEQQFLPLTKDHSPVQEMIDKGILQASEANFHPRKNEINRALGTKVGVTPSISINSLKAKSGDRFIVCSDGLSGLISHEIFAKTVEEVKSPVTCARELIELAKKAGGYDNISVHVVDILQSPFSDSFYSSQSESIEVSNPSVKRPLLFSFITRSILAGKNWLKRRNIFR